MDALTCGTRHFATYSDYRAEPPAPDYNTLTGPAGERPGSVLSNCSDCALRQPCMARQRLNYRMNCFAFSFCLPECEAALTGAVDLLALLSEAPRSISELARLTGKCYGTLWRELRGLRPQGINIIGYGSKAEAIYGRGPLFVRPNNNNRLRILDLLRTYAPLTARDMRDHTHLHVATVRKILRELQLTHCVTICGKQQFQTTDGIIRQAPLWRLTDD